MTDIYAVLGHPIAHSKSPLIHCRFAAQTGQDMSYVAILAPLDGFAAALHDFVAAGGRGANVTVPFKEEAFRLATRLSPRAQAAGAVNTLSFAGPEIVGDNTDGAGIVRDITLNLGRRIVGQRILLLGAGGAARGTILPLLQERPAQLVIANRTAEKARALAREFAGLTTEFLPLKPQGCGFSDLAGECSGEAFEAFDLVINATSAGLDNSALKISDRLFAPGCLAYEMVYGKQTPFMAQARSIGAEVSDGLGMLVEQAAEAFLLWRGIRPDTAPLLKELRGA